MTVTITIEINSGSTYEDLSLVLGRVVGELEDDGNILARGDRVRVNTDGLPSRGVDVEVS